MLWDMIRYENFDINSPYNREAAVWARDQKQFRFPLDERNIRDRINDPKPKTTPTPEPKRLQTVTPEKKRGVRGLIDRFRKRETPASTPSTNSASTSPASPSGELVSRDEIEVVESGIAFIDPKENSQSEAETGEDTGIVFLD